MAAPELEHLWQDAQNWAPPGIYRCAADPRVIVPKRRRWTGWTLNFAHPAAWPVLLAAVTLAAAPVPVLLVTGRPTAPAFLIAAALSIAVLCFGAAWRSERPRESRTSDGTP